MASTKADFSQQDRRWGSHLLGFAKKQTMARYGCYVTSYANVAQAHGHNVTPDDVNNLLKNKGLFAVDRVGERSDISRADALSIIFPDIKYVETINWGNKLADIKYFDVRHDLNTDIIVMLDYHPERSGIQMHFCRVIGINTSKNDVEIVDSYTGKRVWVSSLGKPANKLIYKAVKFRSEPTPKPTPKPVTTTKVVTTTEPVAFETDTREDPTQPKGSRIVKQQGANGVRTKSYTVTYTNGKETKRTLRTDVITTKPIEEIVLIGTYVPPVPSDYDKLQDAKIDANTALLNKVVEFLSALFATFKK